MRESEMRQRVDGFLKRRMKAMLAPALGLGLAVAGCGDWGGSEYMAQFPRGNDGSIVTHDGAGPTPVYSAPVDSQTVDTGMDSAGNAAASSEAQPSDPGVDAGVDTGTDLGSTATKYMAQVPDASPDQGQVTRYMAPLPLV